MDAQSTTFSSDDREGRIAFDQLILETSKQFLTLSAEEMDGGLDAALQTLGEATDLDRISFYWLKPDEHLLERRYGWQRPELGTSAPSSNLAVSEKDYPWIHAHLRSQQPIRIRRLDELPEAAAAERGHCQELGIRSLVGIPVAFRDQPFGFLICSSIRRETQWSTPLVSALEVFGEILAYALARRDAEEALSREKERAQVTLASIGDGVIRTDSSGRIDYLNPVAERLTGWKLADAVGREVTEVYQVVSEATRRPRRNPIEICLVERKTIVLPGLFTLHGHRGEEFTIRDSVAPILDRNGEIDGTILVFRDLTHIRGLEREMAYLASHDTLTGLLNRQELEIYLEAALESAREKKAGHALLYLDLLQFKLINDGFGHVAGDELLRQVADLLKLKVASGDIVGRLGGDQFALLLENRTSAQARGVASDIQQLLSDFRFSWAGQFFDIEASVGIVPISSSSDSVLQILRAAEAACYLAREQGRQRIHIAIPNDASLLQRSGHLQWIHRLRRALAEDQFCLYFQKILSMEGDEAPALHEILVRLEAEDGSHILPDAFIPVAESYELAPLLDRWVIRQTLRYLSQTDAAPLRNDPVSINLSGQSLGDERMRDFITEQLAISGVSPQRIFFEITETAAVANLNRALGFIQALKEIGCRFILDDFGSGLCSFAYLKNLPVDLLKIDGEFVRSMEQDPIRRAMIESINQIGQVMGLATIAEWVETEATFELLKDLGVDYGQGYWIHRPEPLPKPRR